VGVVSKGSYTWSATKNGVYYLICTVGTVSQQGGANPKKMHYWAA
jgi:hypothetical protein